MVPYYINRHPLTCTCDATGCPSCCTRTGTLYYNVPVPEQGVVIDKKWKPHFIFIDRLPVVEKSNIVDSLIVCAPKTVLRSMFSIKTVFSSKVRKEKKNK